jgi:predicted AAA+ superfamily ATPase
MTDYPRWRSPSVKEALKTRRVVVISGARQTGKTTLAKETLDKNSKPYIGIVLYSGEHTLSFGEGMLAVPIASLWG